MAACLVDLTGTVRSRHRRDGDNRDLSDRPGRRRGSARSRLAWWPTPTRLGIDCVGGTLAVPGLVDPASGRSSSRRTCTGSTPTSPSVTTRARAPAGVVRLGRQRGQPRRAGRAALRRRPRAVVVRLRLGRHRHRRGHRHRRPPRPRRARLRRRARPRRRRPRRAGPARAGPAAASRRSPGEPARRPAPVGGRALAAALRSVVHLARSRGGRARRHLRRARRRVRRRRSPSGCAATTLGARWRPCDVRRLALGADAALIGAATVALDRRPRRSHHRRRPDADRSARSA